LTEREQGGGKAKLSGGHHPVTIPYNIRRGALLPKCNTELAEAHGTAEPVSEDRVCYVLLYKCRALGSYIE